jgi:hypothetical protein
MSTTDQAIKLPPGVRLPHSSVKVKELKNAEIAFDFKTTTTQPLQPLLQAKYDDGALLISAIIFIAEKEDVDPESIFVTCQPVISGAGLPQLDLFIVYNAEEIRARKFQGYRVDITIDNPPENLEQIEAFLWDEDPVTSRGTVTSPVGR